MPRRVFGTLFMVALIVLALPLLLIPASYFINENLNKLITTSDGSISSQGITWLTITMGVIVAMLLLPSLHTFKLGPVELETVNQQVTAGKIDVELSRGELVSPTHNMPIYSAPQEFAMALKIRSLIKTDVSFLERTPMPYTPFNITWS